MKKAVLAALVGTLAIGVTTARADTFVFLNTTKIAVADQGTLPAANPYPSTISVSGLIGTVSTATVSLVDINHPSGSDLDVLLVGPQGQKTMLMSDTCTGALAHVNFTFSDSASTGLPASSCTSGTYKPTNDVGCDAGGDSLPTPAPGPPYGSLLSAVAGAAPNGSWSLYAADSCPSLSGEITGGWSLTLEGPQSPPKAGTTTKKKKCKKKKSGKKSADSKSKKKKCKKKKKS